MKTNFDSIYKLMTYQLELDDDLVLIMSDVPNYNVMEELISKFKDSITGKDDEIDYDSYNLEMFQEYVEWKWYFYYTPQADTSIYF